MARRIETLNQKQIAVALEALDLIEAEVRMVREYLRSHLANPIPPRLTDVQRRVRLVEEMVTVFAEAVIRGRLK